MSFSEVFFFSQYCSFSELSFVSLSLLWIILVHIFYFQSCCSQSVLVLNCQFSDLSCLTLSLFRFPFSDSSFLRFVLFKMVLFQMFPVQSCPFSDVSFSELSFRQWFPFQNSSFSYLSFVYVSFFTFQEVAYQSWDSLCYEYIYIYIYIYYT